MRRLQNPVSLLLKDPDRQLPDLLFILHHENRFVSTEKFLLHRFFLLLSHMLFRPGKIYLEGRPMTRLTINPDISSALPHNSISGRQTQPCSFALLFGGKEGFKNSFFDLRSHSHPCVTHRKHYIMTRCQSNMLMSIGG